MTLCVHGCWNWVFNGNISHKRAAPRILSMPRRDWMHFEISGHWRIYENLRQSLFKGMIVNEQGYQFYTDRCKWSCTHQIEITTNDQMNHNLRNIDIHSNRMPSVFRYWFEWMFDIYIVTKPISGYKSLTFTGNFIFYSQTTVIEMIRNASG